MLYILSYTICAIALALMAAFMLLMQALVYGFSRDFGFGVGTGVALTVLLVFINTKIDESQKRKAEKMRRLLGPDWEQHISPAAHFLPGDLGEEIAPGIYHRNEPGRRRGDIG